MSLAACDCEPVSAQIMISSDEKHPCEALTTSSPCLSCAEMKSMSIFPIDLQDTLRCITNLDFVIQFLLYTVDFLSQIYNTFDKALRRVLQVCLTRKILLRDPFRVMICVFWMKKDEFEMTDRMTWMRCNVNFLTTADGLLHVGADDETHEAFDAIAFLGQLSGIRPMHGRCLVQPSRCQVMCSVWCKILACSLQNSCPRFSSSVK